MLNYCYHCSETVSGFHCTNYIDKTDQNNQRNSSDHFCKSGLETPAVTEGFLFSYNCPKKSTKTLSCYTNTEQKQYACLSRECFLANRWAHICKSASGPEVPWGCQGAGLRLLKELCCSSRVGVRLGTCGGRWDFFLLFWLPAGNTLLVVWSCFKWGGKWISATKVVAENHQFHFLDCVSEELLYYADIYWLAFFFKNSVALAQRHGNFALLLIPPQGRKKSSRAND